MNLIALMIVLSIAVFLILLFSWFSLWHDLYVDRYRQRLFLIRQELFDQARIGNIPFDSDEYKALVDLLNGTIRFAHVLTPFAVVSIALLKDRLFQQSKDHFADPRLQLASDNYPEICSFVIRKSAYVTIRYFFNSSLIVKCVFRGIILIRASQKRISQEALARKLEPFMDEIGVTGKIDSHSIA